MAKPVVAERPTIPNPTRLEQRQKNSKRVPVSMIPRRDGSSVLAAPPFSITGLHVEIASGKRLNLLCLVSTVPVTSVTILAKAKQDAIPLSQSPYKEKSHATVGEATEIDASPLPM